jgi:exopolyphosphatase/guanosine-5'-triphosphate,3'-diphosphate pyrophosphatase
VAGRVVPEPRRRAGPGRAREGVYGALDLGTNNCRLLIARPNGRGFEVVDAFSRIVRLGEGLSASGRLSEPAMDRTLRALKVCAGKMRRGRATEVRAVATEACRKADNCADFLARVRRETGIRLEIISSREEARLGLCGCVPLLNPARAHALLFDIGGGSTEVSWVRLADRDGGPDWPARPKPRLCAWESLPVGVVGLAERYGGVEVADAAYRAMIDEVADALVPFEARHGLAGLALGGEMQMLGTSGTVTTLAGIDKRLPRYDRAQVDGAHLGFDTVAALSGRIAAMSYDERVAHPCIGRERADLVIAGCAILEAICRTWPVGRLRVADRGLREGILLSLMAGGEPCGPLPAVVPCDPAS